jgi:hypothetical protein
MSFERKFYLLKENLDIHKNLRTSFLHQTNCWCQNSQEVLPYRRFGGR